MRKRLGVVLLAGCMLCTTGITTRAETLIMDGKAIEYNLSAISLYVNNEKIETKVMDPIQLNGRVLVPAREVFEAMGAKVVWEHSAKRVTVQYKDKTVVLVINNPVATINGESVTMDVPGKIINDKVMIPVRFVSEAMGLSVQWDSANRAVRINEKQSSTPDAGTTQNLSGQTFTGISNKNQITIPAGSHQTATVQNVVVSESSEVMTAIISASSAISEATISTMPGKVIVDIKNSKSQLSSQITPGTNTYVKSIRTSQFTSDTTRVVFDLKSGAQINASLSSDRTRLNIQLTKQNMEQISISTVQNKDYIYFKGLGTSQMVVSQGSGSKEIQFILPNVQIAENINWSGIKSLFIKQITMKQVGNELHGTISLNAGVSYELQDTTAGVNLILQGTNLGDNETGGEVPPEESKPDQETGDSGSTKPEEVKQGLTYTAGKLNLSNITGLTTSKIKVTDDYRNKKLVFDLGADYSGILKSQTLNVNDSRVKTITISNSGTTKITVDTQTIYTYNLSQSNGQITLQLVRPKEKYNQIIVVDIGHGGSDSGTVGNGLKEKDVNFNQGMALYRLLEADSNIKVYMTRETDVYPTLQFRATLANEIEADLFVSIHNNSASSESVQGAETLYYPSTTDTRGKAIAQLIQNSLVKDSGMVNRGIKARSDLYVLKNTNMPAVLIETGFLSNASDASRMNTTSFTNTWAKGIYNTIVEAFKLL